MATIVMNQSDQQIVYKVYIGTQAVESKILPHAIQTLVIR